MQKTAELLKETSKTSFSVSDNVNEVLADNSEPKRTRGKPRKKNQSTDQQFEIYNT